MSLVEVEKVVVETSLLRWIRMSPKMVLNGLWASNHRLAKRVGVYLASRFQRVSLAIVMAVVGQIASVPLTHFCQQ